MTRGKNINGGDKQALLDLVREEIRAHSEGRLERLSTNAKLGELIYRSPESIKGYLRNLPFEDRTYRSKEMQKTSGLENGFGKLTKKQRQVIGKRGGRKCIERYGNPSRNISRDQRQKNARDAYLLGKGLGSLTRQQKQKTSRDRYASQRELGKKGLGSLTRQQRQETGKKSYWSENGLSNLTREQRQEIAKKVLETLRKQKYFFNSNFYDSQSEAAVATLMEKYIPNWKVEEGKTFQVHDIPKSIDFLVDGTFIEWHPILMFASKGNLGDIPSQAEYSSYKKVISKMSPETKKEFDKKYRQVLAINYRNGRQAAIDASEQYRGLDVVLVQTPEELYDLVIVRFGSEISTREDFIREFKEIKKQVKEANKKN